MNSSTLHLSGLVPIVIGVTGHRNIFPEDAAILEKSTLEILTDLAGKTPNSPHVLISCLAEGADRIAARVALQQGWSLGVILPAAAEIYEKDFESENSKIEFREYLAAASWIEIINKTESVTPDYSNAGLRMLQQSQLLIAYWDGKTLGLKGGTSDIVEIFLSEIPDAGIGLTGNSIPDARPVIHIMSRRLGEEDQINQAEIGVIRWTEPHPVGMTSEGEEDRWDEVFKHIDCFNADAKAVINSNRTLVEKNRSYLDGGTFAGSSKTFPLNDPCGSMFALADVMSTKAQEERNRLFYSVAGLAAIAIVLEQLFAGPFPSPVILGAAVFTAIRPAILTRSP